jgi:hypothetical protein
MPRPYSLAEIKDIVRRTAPTLYLHDDEEYLPSSVDWYLERVTMVSAAGDRVPLAGNGMAPQDKLVVTDQWPFTGDSSAYWLEAPDSALGGDLASARSYVSIRRVKAGFLDITHWFWYPGNGCGSARVRTLAFDTTVVTEERVALTTLGFHVSDWEKVTIRVVDDGSGRIDSVYFAQHAGGHWLQPDALEMQPSGGFAVYSSRSGHASYPTPGEHYSAHIKTAPPGVWAKLTPAALEIWLRNDTMRGSRKVDCAANHEIISIQEGADGIPLTDDGTTPADAVPFFGRIQRDPGGAVRIVEPRWLNYPYRWGQETEQKISHEVVFEALKMAIGPLCVYGVLTVGAMLPILGTIAGLLVPLFAKMENECGKPGPKNKYIPWDANDVVDEDSGPEPENLFHEAVGGALAPMVAWIENAASDVASWTKNAVDDAGNWVEGAAGDTAHWFEDAATVTGNWCEQAGKDAVDWVEDAGRDAGRWIEDTAGDAGRALDPRNWGR